MWPSTLSGRLPVDALVGHYPTNKLIGRELILYQKIFPPPHTKGWSYPVLDPVSQAYPEVQGRSLTCYSPVRHSSTPASWGLSVRLACVKHAASVRPEPGSNSPQKISSIRTRPSKRAQHLTKTTGHQSKNISGWHPTRKNPTKHNFAHRKNPCP